jgi:hypothetical protein
LSIIQGPFSVAPCQTLISRFATFSSLCQGNVMPIPGAKTAAQAEEFAGALVREPLPSCSDDARAILCRPVPNPRVTIRGSFGIAVWGSRVRAGGGVAGMGAGGRGGDHAARDGVHHAREGVGDVSPHQNHQRHHVRSTGVENMVFRRTGVESTDPLRRVATPPSCCIFQYPSDPISTPRRAPPACAHARKEGALHACSQLSLASWWGVGGGHTRALSPERSFGGRRMRPPTHTHPAPPRCTAASVRSPRTRSSPPPHSSVSTLQLHRGCSPSAGSGCHRAAQRCTHGLTAPSTSSRDRRACAPVEVG